MTPLKLGAAVWGLLAFLSFQGWAPLDPITLLYLLAPWIVVPLGFQVIDGLAHRMLLLLQPVAAGLATASFFLPPGWTAAGLAAPWFLWTAAAGTVGLRRAWRRKQILHEQTAMDLGLLFLAAGGGWLVTSRLGAEPMGFREPIVLLTAVHFHFTGFAANVISGAAGRHLRAHPAAGAALYPAFAGGIALGMPAVAAGFVFSPTLQVGAVCVLSACLAGLAVLLLLMPAAPLGRASKALLAVAALSLLAGMALAAAYSMGEFLGRPALSILAMARTHGLLNAFGFTLCGLLGWKFTEGGRPWAR